MRRFVILTILGISLISPVLSGFSSFTTYLSNAGLTAIDITTYATCDGVVDDTAGWTNFVAANQGGNVVLTIPIGKTCCFLTSSPQPELAKGVNFLRIIGYGSTITNQCNGTIGPPYFLGSAGLTDDIQENNTTSSAVQTVLASASFVTLITPSETSRFTANRWALLSGLDLQGYGYPPNFGFHDFVFITSKDGGCQGTGTVCFRSPIANSYKSNWPDYNSANPPVGPARLYALGPAWGGSVEYRGVTIIGKDAGDGLDIQLKTSGLSIKFIDATFTGSAALSGRPTCPYATDNILFQLTNVSAVSCLIEMDKSVDQVIVNNSTVRSIQFQSSSVNLATVDSSVVFLFSGTPVRTTLSRSTITNLIQFGSGYGSDTSVTYLTLGNTIASIEDVGATEPNVDTKTNPWTMSGGVMTRSISAILADTAAVYWAIPGHSYNFTGVGCSPCAFTVSDIVQSGGNVQITTNLAGGFPGSALTVTAAPIARN